MKIIITFLIAFNFPVNILLAGLDTGSNSRSIFKIISFSKDGELRSLRVRSDRRLLNRGITQSETLPKISIDLNTISEVTLKDGTIYKIDEINELLKRKRRR